MDNFILWVRLCTLILLTGAALVSDIRTNRIRNSLVLPFILIGLAIYCLDDGVDGLLRSLLGTLVPFVLLAALYALRMLGAGDIKLFCATGAVMGPGFVLFSMMCSFLAGGIIALVLMAVRRNAKERFRYLWNYIKSCVLTRTLLKYSEGANSGNKPYGPDEPDGPGSPNDPDSPDHPDSLDSFDSLDSPGDPDYPDGSDSPGNLDTASRAGSSGTVRNSKDGGAKFPFACAAACGTILSVFIQFFLPKL